MPKPISPALQSGNALAAGLLRCYTLHEGSGSTLHDYASSNRDATTRTGGSAAAATWGSDPDHGGYITLNGTNQDATAPDAGLPAGASPRTLAFLARASAASDGDVGFVIGYGDAGNGLFALGYATPDQNGPSKQVFWATTLAHGIGGTARMVDGNWHLCVATIDSSTMNLRMYVDGSPIGILADASGATSEANEFTPLQTSPSGTMFLGQLGGTGNTGLYFRGDLAGAWAWDRALSPSDVANFAADPWQMVRAPAPTHAITVSPPSASLPSGTQSVALTPTITNDSSPIAVAVSGGGTLSASSVASGSPVTFTKPAGQTGSATVTFSAPGVSDVVATVDYAADEPTPTLTLSPTTAGAIAAGSVVSMAATKSSGAANLSATVSGGGTLSTEAPTSGVAFTWTQPQTGSGTAVVTVVDSVSGLSATCTITYTASQAAPTGYTLSASPPSVQAGFPATITATLAGGTYLSSPLVIALAGPGLSFGGPITISNGQSAGSTTATAGEAGTYPISASHTGGGFSGGDGSTSLVATASQDTSTYLPYGQVFDLLAPGRPAARARAIGEDGASYPGLDWSTDGVRELGSGQYGVTRLLPPVPLWIQVDDGAGGPSRFDRWNGMGAGAGGSGPTAAQIAAIVLSRPFSATEPANSIAGILSGLPTLQEARSEIAAAVATRAVTGSEPGNSIAGILSGLPTLDEYRAEVAGQIASTPVVLPATPPAAYATAAGQALAASAITAIKADTARLAGMVETTMVDGSPVDRFRFSVVVQAPAGPASVDADTIVAAINAAGVRLRADGLDAIVVESGINARQALAIDLAASAGVLAGAGSGLITIRGAGVADTRITAATDQVGNRIRVEMDLPD